MGKRIFCSSANCRNVSLVRPNKVFLWSAACRWWDLLGTAGPCGAEKASIVPADKGAQTGEEGRPRPRGLGLRIRQAVDQHTRRGLRSLPRTALGETVLLLLALPGLQRSLKEEGAA